MSDPRTAALCRLCRNINLRFETFLEVGCRYPTSLEYISFEDDIRPASHYVTGERLDDEVDYTDEALDKELEFSHIVKDRHLQKEKALGTLEEVSARAPGCTLCALVVHAVCNAPEALEENAICYLRFLYVDYGNSTFAPNLYKNNGEAKHGRYRCVLVINHFDIEFHPVSVRRDLLWFGGQPYGDQIDFALCKRWLHACETTHHRCNPQSWQRHMKATPSLRLIDVQDMCLADAIGTERYVALSYVWGSVSMFQTTTSSMEGLYQLGGLRNVWQGLSKTVQDAILAVRGLDERYLWTDAICIIQDDPTDKAELIREMHVVYARAALTLVAAEGTHANAGLPGIRPNSRPPSDLWNMGKDLALLPSQTVRQVLLTCPWTQRAWTFQEGMLSSRTLIFTNRTVSLTCCTSSWSEHVNSPNEGQEPPWTYAQLTSLDFRSLLPGMPAQLEDQTGSNVPEDDEAMTDELFFAWTELINTISSRSLSYESDIPFAAAGMISVLQTIFNVNTIYGLPERRLEQFLFWSPKEPGCLRRRRDLNGNAILPSWSWAGWVGSTSWNEHLAIPFGDIVYEIEWRGLSGVASEPVTLQCKGRGTVCDDVALAPGLEDGVRHVETLDLPILMFDTRTASLRISTTDERPSWTRQLQLDAWILTYGAGEEGSGVYCVSNPLDASHAVGSVVLDSAEAICELENGVTTFAIVSSCTYQDSIHVEDELVTFHWVLALRKHDGIFERVGHGAVLVDKVSSVEWQQETVMLR